MPEVVGGHDTGGGGFGEEAGAPGGLVLAKAADGDVLDPVAVGGVVPPVDVAADDLDGHGLPARVDGEAGAVGDLELGVVRGEIGVVAERPVGTAPDRHVALVGGDV